MSGENTTDLVAVSLWSHRGSSAHPSLSLRTGAHYAASTWAKSERRFGSSPAASLHYTFLTDSLRETKRGHEVRVDNVKPNGRNNEGVLREAPYPSHILTAHRPAQCRPPIVKEPKVAFLHHQVLPL